jgi:hypothetical protein
MKASHNTLLSEKGKNRIMRIKLLFILDFILTACLFIVWCVYVCVCVYVDMDRKSQRDGYQSAHYLSCVYLEEKQSIHRNPAWSHLSSIDLLSDRGTKTQV